MSSIQKHPAKDECEGKVLQNQVPFSRIRTYQKRNIRYLALEKQ